MIDSRGFRALVLSAALGAALSCSTGRPPNATTVTASASRETILEGPNGVIVRIPAGALAEDTAITVSVAPRSRRPGNAVSVAPGVRLAPAGQTFLLPVEILIPIEPSALPAGATIDEVKVNRSESGSTVFVPLPTRRRGDAVATVTEHFSDFVAAIAEANACGDAMCMPDESCESCPLDCGLCLGANACGNARCESNESCASCDFDCGGCPDVDGGEPEDAGADDAGPIDAGPLVATTTSAGVTWIQDPFPGPLTFADAVALCEALDVNGTADWRVPTRLEFVSMMDFALADPVFDPAELHVAQGAAPWTATDLASDTTRAWRVNSSGVVADGPKTATAGTSTFCVRDAGGAPVPYAFVDNGDGTTTHVTTGLVWQTSASLTTRDQANSAVYCAALSLGAFSSGWRVPDARELMMLVDDRRTAPSLDPTGFPSGSSTNFWSSTIPVGSPTLGFSVSFNLGGSLMFGNTGAQLVRCVH